MGEEERRMAERFRIDQMIGYYPNREEYLWAEGLNLSAGGLQCSSKEAVDPLTNVYLMIGVPSAEGEHLVHCEGFVAYSRIEEDGLCRFGVRFESIAEEDKPFLNAFLGQLGEIPPPAAFPTLGL